MRPNFIPYSENSRSVERIRNRRASTAGTADNRLSSFVWEAKLHVCIMSGRKNAALSSSSVEFCDLRYSRKMDIRPPVFSSGLDKPSRNLLSVCIPGLLSIKSANAVLKSTDQASTEQHLDRMQALFVIVLRS